MLEALPIEPQMKLLQFPLEHPLSPLVHTHQMVQQLEEVVHGEVPVEDKQAEHTASLGVELHHLPGGLVGVHLEHLEVVVEDQPHYQTQIQVRTDGQFGQTALAEGLEGFAGFAALPLVEGGQLRAVLFADLALDVVAALEVLYQLEEGLLAGQFAPLLGRTLPEVVAPVLALVEGLFVNLDCQEALVEGVDEVGLDGVLLDLAAEGLHLGDEFLDGVGERGGEDCFPLEEVGIDLVVEGGEECGVGFADGFGGLAHG